MYFFLSFELIFNNPQVMFPKSMKLLFEIVALIYAKFFIESL